MTNAPRKFTDEEAKREQTPLFIGLVGPSGSGKTYSALRLATGIQRVMPGPIFVVDTETNRSKHYADKFAFRHIDFRAPFDPLSYLAAVEHCVRQGARTVIVDSMSHEHEGPGGVLEMHTAEAERLARAWGTSVDKANIPAWNKPKAERRRLINSLIQLGCNLILCFRAKEKIKVVAGKNPVQLGWQPIAGEEFIYECALNCLLMPGSKGVPEWKPPEDGEKQMIKLPEQFAEMFANKPQLTEDLGERLATWANGGVAVAPPTVESIAAGYANCADDTEFTGLEAQRARVWKTTSAADKARLKAAADSAKERLQAERALGASNGNGASRADAEPGSAG